MPPYTTGELADRCGVSVRTVQFYDAKGLLKPSALSAGGRRLYAQEDLDRLRTICLLKALGLTLGTIKGILDSEHPESVLSVLLEEQSRRLGAEIRQRQQQMEAVRTVRETLRLMDRIPIRSVGGMERMMNDRKRLKQIHARMLAIGIGMDILQIAALAVWIRTGLWQPFAVCLPPVVLLGCWMTRLYHRHAAYICPACGNRFQPTLHQLLFSRHTPRTRRLQCPVCGQTGYCVETAAENR